MKIKVVVGENDVSYNSYQLEFDTEDYEKLKNLSIEEVRELIDEGEVELEEGYRLEDFVKERGNHIKSKGYTEINIEVFEEI